MCAQLKRAPDQPLREGRVIFLTVIAALSLAATATVVHLDSAVRVTLFSLTVAAACAGFVVAWSGFARGPDSRALTGVVIAEVAEDPVGVAEDLMAGVGQSHARTGQTDDGGVDHASRGRVSGRGQQEHVTDVRHAAGRGTVGGHDRPRCSCLATRSPDPLREPALADRQAGSADPLVRGLPTPVPDRADLNLAAVSHSP